MENLNRVKLKSVINCYKIKKSMINHFAPLKAIKQSFVRLFG